MYWYEDSDERHKRNQAKHYECVTKLKSMHTRELLKWLQYARACGGWFSPCDDYSYGVSIEDLKTELATREHIPGRLEAKANRRAAAMMHRGKKGPEWQNHRKFKRTLWSVFGRRRRVAGLLSQQPMR